MWCATIKICAAFIDTIVLPGFCRDGVSEGQFSQVLLEEMDAIRRVLALDFSMTERNNAYFVC